LKRILNLSLLFIGLAALFTSATASAQIWKFGVISDTQWTIADDGKNPNTCAADIIHQVNGQFISNGVKFVVSVGDMVDKGGPTNDHTRALYAQELYDGNIGFYPLRGNHEAAENGYMDSSADYRYSYPQIVPGLNAGWNNNTPADIFTSLSALYSITNPPASKLGTSFLVGSNFSAPNSNSTTDGVSYAFQYINATFVLLDQFKSPYYSDSHVPEQLSWIDSTLKWRPANTHGFVFSHKNLLGGNHKDSLFGAQGNGNDPGDGYRIDPNIIINYDEADLGSYTVATKQANYNKFLGSLYANSVKYCISGHDHHHYNSIVTSPDLASRVHQLIGQSDSSKFYTPVAPFSGNDTPIEQELARIGFYIFTVDGPRVTIDYWADDHGNWQSGNDFPDGDGPLTNLTTPALHFVKRSTTGYSLNGKEQIVAQGASYAMSDDTGAAGKMESGFKGTSMSILAGTNASTVQTNYSKPTSKAVNTGWAPAEAGLASDILTLWGMNDLGNDTGDTVVLSMSFDKTAPRQGLGNGGFGIATRRDGKWVNAAGDSPTFVKGPWTPSYGSGYYGVDASTKTAWAVINRGDEFAVTAGIEPTPGHSK
jgi:hypothetical protein